MHQAYLIASQGYIEIYYVYSFPALQVEQSLAMIRIEQRDKIAQLPVGPNRSGQDEFFLFFLMTETRLAGFDYSLAACGNL
jgi:hypothetical protein